MFIKSYRSIMLFVLFALIAMFSTQSWAKKYPEHPDSLSIINVSFNPTFITVGGHRPIKIAVTLPEDSPVFPSDELILEQQRFMPDGNSVFLPIRKSSHDPSHGQRIVTLRYDGNNTGQVTAGMVFTGYASFHEDVSGEIQLRVVAKVKHSKHTFVSTPFSIPVNHACFDNYIGTVGVRVGL